MGNETSSKAKPAMDNMKTANSTVKQRKNETSSNAESKAVDEVLDTMTEHTVEDLTGIIHDVQSTSKGMLRKLNEAMFNQQCTCECHTEERQREWAELKTRVQKLEKDGKQKDEVVKRLMEELKALHDELMTLQNSYEPVGSEEAETAVPDKPKVVEAPAKAADLALQNDINAPKEPKHEKIDEEFVIELDKDSSGSSVLGTTVGITSEVSELVSDGKEQGCDTESAGFVRAADATVLSGCDGDASGHDKAEDKHRERATSVIMKPNFLKPVSIPVQTQAQQGDQAHESGLKNLGGIHSVVLVDISASIAAGHGWTQTQKFCHDYFNGLAKIGAQHGLDQEHVAMVTFGHSCSVVQRFTNKMDVVSQKFDSLKVGGPSPLFGGLYFALAAAGSSEKTAAHVSGIRVNSKIIVITDGHPTDTCLYEGPDTVELQKKDETMVHILEVVEKIRHSKVDVFFVPVGNTNKDFFELMQSVSECKMLSYEDGEKMSKRLFLTCQLEPADLLLGSERSSQRTKGTDLSESDKALLEEIKRDGRKRMFDDFLSGRIGENDKDKYNESTNKNFPPIGTRVRRGPDWSWDEQDSHGPGTVIGHSADSEQLWVHWDKDDHINVYHYNTRYDVLVVDEPRVLRPRERLQVGCVVRTGKDWSDSDTSVKSFDRGVVIKLLADGTKLEVRWNNGKRGEYIYDVTGKQEVEYSQPGDCWGRGGYVLGDGSETPKKSKNKNKNF